MVTWRAGGTRAGKQEQETFGEEEAKSFRPQVELARHQWPHGGVKGLGFVAQPVVLEADEPTKKVVLFREWA